MRVSSLLALLVSTGLIYSAGISPLQVVSAKSVMNCENQTNKPGQPWILLISSGYITTEEAKKDSEGYELYSTDDFVKIFNVPNKTLKTFLTCNLPVVDSSETLWVYYTFYDTDKQINGKMYININNDGRKFIRITVLSRSFS